MLPCLVWATECHAVSLLSLWEILSYTTFCSNLPSTKCLVQFIRLSIAYLKWDEFLYILHFNSVLWRQGCSTLILRRYCTIQQFSRGGASALHYGTAVLATIFLMQGCCVATYYSSQWPYDARDLVNWQGLGWGGMTGTYSSITWLKMVPPEIVWKVLLMGPFKSLSAKDLVISRDLLW